MASRAELVDIVRKAGCPVGLGHKANDEELPDILAYLAATLKRDPVVEDVVYHRTIRRRRQDSWLVHTDHGRVTVSKVPGGFKTTVDGHTSIADIRMVGARLKILRVIGLQPHPNVDFSGKRVTLIGNLIEVDDFVLVALAQLFQSNGAKEVEFVGLTKPNLVHRHQHQHA